MRIFANCIEMDNEVRRDLHEMGTIVHPETMQDKDVRNDDRYTTLELSPYDFMIIDGSDRFAMLQSRKNNVDWVKAEFEERVNGERANPGAAWHHRYETWAPFIHDGKFAYTYGERICRLVHQPDNFAGVDALDVVIQQLRENPNTRQAVLPIFNGSDDMPNMGGLARIPCSLHYQFTIRQDELRIFYVMRSSDYATHFAYDIALALELQQYVADALQINVGRMSFFTGSLHLYKKDWDQSTF